MTSMWAAVLRRLRDGLESEYRITNEIGRGGQAAVFLAEDRRLLRKVAIKVLAPGTIGDDAAVERFAREARTVAQLEHANIVTIYDVKQIEELHCFVMRYVVGRSLAEVIEAAGQLPLPVIRAVAFQMGAALQYAHRKNVIHRDIKPANVLFDEDGNAIVTDFGIAKDVGGGSRSTKTGTLMGTPAYMSPEQCYQLPVSWSSDQYSLGIVLYEMLTGRVPFDGSNYEIMRGHTEQAPPAPRSLRADCPLELEWAVLRMLEKKPEHRFLSLAAALDALEAAPLSDTDPVRPILRGLALKEGMRIGGPVTPTGPDAVRPRMTPSPAAPQSSPAVPRASGEKAPPGPSSPRFTPPRGAPKLTPPAGATRGAATPAPNSSVSSVPGSPAAPPTPASKAPVASSQTPAPVAKAPATAPPTPVAKAPATAPPAPVAKAPATPPPATPAPSATADAKKTIQPESVPFALPKTEAPARAPETGGVPASDVAAAVSPASGDPVMKGTPSRGRVVPLALGLAAIAIVAVVGRALLAGNGSEEPSTPDSAVVVVPPIDTGTRPTVLPDTPTVVSPVDTAMRLRIVWERRDLLPGEGVELRIEASRGRESVRPAPSASWTSLDPGIATVDARSGRVTAVSPGAARLRATSGDLMAPPVNIRVLAREVTRLSVTGPDALQADGQGRLQFDARDQRNAVMPNAPVEWRSTNQSVLSVEPNGSYRVVGPGQATVIVRAGAVSSERSYAIAAPANTGAGTSSTGPATTTGSTSTSTSIATVATAVDSPTTRPPPDRPAEAAVTDAEISQAVKVIADLIGERNGSQLAARYDASGAPKQRDDLLNYLSKRIVRVADVQVRSIMNTPGSPRARIRVLGRSNVDRPTADLEIAFVTEGTTPGQRLRRFVIVSASY